MLPACFKRVIRLNARLTAEAVMLLRQLRSRKVVLLQECVALIDDLWTLSCICLLQQHCYLIRLHVLVSHSSCARCSSSFNSVLLTAVAAEDVLTVVLNACIAPTVSAKLNL